MKISVLYPSRSRPVICKQTFEKWRNACKKEELIEWIISVDEDDPFLSEYIKLYNFFKPYDAFDLLINQNRSCVDAINGAAEKCTGDIIVVISDDFSPCIQWDWQLKNFFENNYAGTDILVKTPDGLQPTLITLPIMGRQYYERFGYVYYPEYKHMFCDQEMTAIGIMLGKVWNVDIPFEHRHYSAGKSLKDAINERNDATWEQGANLFNERLKKNFGIENPVVPYSAIKWK